MRTSSLALLVALAPTVPGCTADLPDLGTPEPGSGGGGLETTAPWSLEPFEIRVPLAGTGPVWLARDPVGGTCIGAETDGVPVVVRLDVDGVLDPAFADGVPVPALAGLSGVSARPDGACVAAGVDATGRIAATALLSNGQPDPNFATEVGRPGALDATAMADGGIGLMAFEHSTTRVLRLLPDGRADLGFGVSGEAALPVAGAADLAASPEGSVTVAAGWSIVRLDPFGREDPSFGEAGWLELDLLFGSVSLSLLAFAENDSVWLVAEEFVAGGRVVHGRIADTGSHLLSPAQLAVPAGDRLLALVPPFAVGYHSDGRCTSPTVYRFADDSIAFDLTFGDAGVWRLPAASCDAAASAAAVEADGTVLVAGWDGGVVVHRFTPE